MDQWLTYALIVGVLAGSALALWLIGRRRGRRALREDSYTHGLELWLAGDLDGAAAAMREAIERDKTAVEPYLQLGNLLRLKGDPRRAAALHRGLTVRSDISAEKRVSIVLALAEDLNDLKLWDEAGEILDALQRREPGGERYWLARFRQRLGSGDADAAARVLKDASRKSDPEARPVWRDRWELFQLDRSLSASAGNDAGRARRLLRGVDEKGANAHRRIHAAAEAARVSDDLQAAVSLLTEGLLQRPDAAALMLAPLESCLLESGHFERTIPILEAACAQGEAPVSLSITLALLYEKIGDRERAVRLLESRVGDKGLTPDAVAPLLRILVNDLPDSDFTRVWRGLSLPVRETGWRCGECGCGFERPRWFCPRCRSFGSLKPVPESC